ncbi:MAG: hypothetical protein NW215_02830 [Hyphomicrobiales bacterium]|nr:hypothetical protein [Hyphomicrobiales bacterium]
MSERTSFVDVLGLLVAVIGLMFVVKDDLRKGGRETSPGYEVDHRSKPRSTEDVTGSTRPDEPTIEELIERTGPKKKEKAF